MRFWIGGFHRQRRGYRLICLGHILNTAAIELRTKFGIMETKDDKVTRFREKKEITNVWMNAGIYHLQRKVLKDLPKKGDIEKTVFPDYAKKGLLNTVKFRNTKWYSVDSFKDMEECSLQVHKIIK